MEKLQFFVLIHLGDVLSGGGFEGFTMNVTYRPQPHQHWVVNKKVIPYA
ncbi:hypothetical protein [Shewanella benthica]|uniref:Uncharacterized protein n=1 Tax=Shewanella benthica KT99 TaxID=314608 RepID=A9D8Y6_9GAMM|nr:hypothetical protein [Shewanella benthica]EDQ00887.1 hypothetical protein KT99_05322 [Shewanella benthica KT99]